MDKETLLRTIEDLLDSSDIPVEDYLVTMDKTNGMQVTIKNQRKRNSISHMYALSEIINSVSQDWEVMCSKECVLIIVN